MKEYDKTPKRQPNEVKTGENNDSADDPGYWKKIEENAGNIS